MMNEDKKRVCGTCAWWANEKPYTGECREGRPKNSNEDKPWAETDSEDWCRHHSFTTGWEEDKPKRPDSDYVQFLERLRKGPPPEEEEEGPLREAIEYDRGRRVSQDVIKALQERLREARWLITVRFGAIEARGDWYIREAAWLKAQDDE